MKKILPEKLKFYPQAHQDLRNSRNQLRSAISRSEVNFESLSQLEIELVKEAISEIANQRIDLYLTSQPQEITPDRVYLFCDEQGNLQDLTPLLPFVSPEKRAKYKSARKDYLGSE